MNRYIESARVNANKTRNCMIHGKTKEAHNAKNRATHAADAAARYALNVKTVEAARNAAKAREHAVRARKYLNHTFGRFRLST